jgi:hypothetical protein
MRARVTMGAVRGAPQGRHSAQKCEAVNEAAQIETWLLDAQAKAHEGELVGVGINGAGGMRLCSTYSIPRDLLCVATRGRWWFRVKGGSCSTAFIEDAAKYALARLSGRRINFGPATPPRRFASIAGRAGVPYGNDFATKADVARLLREIADLRRMLAQARSAPPLGTQWRGNGRAPRRFERAKRQSPILGPT